ncbi:Eukaryotic porin/Tom40 [Artemisia annua]|uniref:Eukaryotic porin/Tom40 n=1 Tax=Artemisia annua TaxID=35608 RepID=A0A2U1MGK5_ARTAN|nr:Eukaryotic porin/Tom40 [Artemisia annua]
MPETFQLHYQLSPPHPRYHLQCPRLLVPSLLVLVSLPREVQEEQGWLSFLHGWCVYVADRLAYLDAIIRELELCRERISVVRFLVELRNGGDVVFADAVTYFKSIREFEAEKLDNLHLFLQASAAHVARRRQFVARFSSVNTAISGSYEIVRLTVPISELAWIAFLIIKPQLLIQTGLLTERDPPVITTHPPVPSSHVQEVNVLSSAAYIIYHYLLLVCQVYQLLMEVTPTQILFLEQEFTLMALSSFNCKIGYSLSRKQEPSTVPSGRNATLQPPENVLDFDAGVVQNVRMRNHYSTNNPSITVFKWIGKIKFQQKRDMEHTSSQPLDHLVHHDVGKLEKGTTATCHCHNLWIGLLHWELPVLREVIERHDTFAAESSKRVRNHAAYFGETSNTFPSHAPVILDFEAGIVRNVGDDSARQYIHDIHCIGPIQCDVGQRCRVHGEDLQTVCHPRHHLEDIYGPKALEAWFLEKFPYRSIIAELLDLHRDVVSFAVGTFFLIQEEEGWWYLGCRKFHKKWVPLVSIDDVRSENEERAFHETRQKLFDKDLPPRRPDDYHTFPRVAEPLIAMVMGASFQRAQHLAQCYDRIRHDAEAHIFICYCYSSRTLIMVFVSIFEGMQLKNMLNCRSDTNMYDVSLQNTITVGTQHALDPLTTVKARYNHLGKANALIQHEWRPKSLFTVSGKVDTNAIDKIGKLGICLGS